MRRRLKNERGAAAVEFALVLPIFFLLVFGIIQYGFYFWTAETANSSAREVARRMAVGECWEAGARFTFAQSHAPRLDTVVADDLSGATAGDEFTVTVTADGDLIGLIPLPNDGAISREYVARLEYEVDTGACPS